MSLPAFFGFGFIYLFFTCVFQVEELRVRDANSGLKVAQVLEGFISRKVVKQTVMTVVYGVTRYGGRLQIEKRLKEIDEFPKVQLWSRWLMDPACHFIFSARWLWHDRVALQRGIPSIVCGTPLIFYPGL